MVKFLGFLATGLIGSVTADKANAISFTSFVKVSRCHLTLTLAPTSLSSRVGPQAYGKGQIIATSHDRFAPKWWFSKGNLLFQGNLAW